MSLLGIFLRSSHKMIGIVVDNIVSATDDHVISVKSTIIVNEQSGLIEDIVEGTCADREDLLIYNFDSATTVLPGFIDCHVHLTIFEDDYQLDHLRLSSASKGLRALKAAQGLLQAGFTTLRSAGDADAFYPSFAVAKSIEKGEFVGPRIVGAGHYISVTGGGGDINFLSADNCPCCTADGVIADGKEQMVAAVRKEIKYGSDWIKILATGAFMSASTGAKDSPENTHMSHEEIRACVEEANRRQVHVMAHAHGAEGIALASNAGIVCFTILSEADFGLVSSPILQYYICPNRLQVHRTCFIHRCCWDRSMSAEQYLDYPDFHDRRVL